MKDDSEVEINRKSILLSILIVSSVAVVGFLVGPGLSVVDASSVPDIELPPMAGECPSPVPADQELPPRYPSEVCPAEPESESEPGCPWADEELCQLSNEDLSKSPFSSEFPSTAEKTSDGDREFTSEQVPFQQRPQQLFQQPPSIAEKLEDPKPGTNLQREAFPDLETNDNDDDSKEDSGGQDGDKYQTGGSGDASTGDDDDKFQIGGSEGIQDEDKEQDQIEVEVEAE